MSPTKCPACDPNFAKKLEHGIGNSWLIRISLGNSLHWQNRWKQRMERAAFAGQWWRPFLVAGPPTKWSSCLHCLFDIIGFCRVLYFPTNCFKMQLLVHYSYSRPKFLIIMTITMFTKMWTTMLDIRRNIGGALVAAQEIECGAPPTHLPTRVRKTWVAG